MWYKINENSPPSKLPGISQGLMIPDEKGTYACIAVYDLGKTSISKGYLCEFLGSVQPMLDLSKGG